MCLADGLRQGNVGIVGKGDVSSAAVLHSRLNRLGLDNKCQGGHYLAQSANMPKTRD